MAEIGEVQNNRVVVSIIKKPNTTLHEVKCLKCGRITKLTNKAFRESGCTCSKGEKFKKTCLERYGVESVSQVKEIREKAKSTLKQRYGVDNPTKSSEVREKVKQTNVEKYGEEHFFQSITFKEAARKTSQEKYGVDHPTKSAQVQAAKTATCTERYGAPMALLNNEVQAKARATCQEHYGCDNAASAAEVQAQIRSTSQIRFGCTCPLANEEVKEKVRVTCLERYKVTSPLQNPEVQAKARATCQERYGCDNAMNNPEIRARAAAAATKQRHESGYRSLAELEIEAFVHSLGLATTHYSSGAREIDVFIPELNIGIEHHGLYWHSEEHGRMRHYHLDKLKLAQASGIKLIQLWSHLWMKRQEQVKSFLRAKLGRNEHRVGVRKCTVQEIDKSRAREFLEKYHIQGSSNHIELALGATTANGELIAVATFAAHHRGTGEKVLNRLCSKENWTCSGFLGKAVRLAFAHFNQPIISWVDRCWSEGESYINAGFIQQTVHSPDYFYIDLKHADRVVAKQSFRKVDDRTETQRAADEGMSRVWDCGKVRFVYAPT